MDEMMARRPDPVGWMTEIARAADDLGYGIVHLEPARIELVPLTSGKDGRIVVECYYLSGAYLRTVLVPIRRT